MVSSSRRRPLDVALRALALLTLALAAVGQAAAADVELGIGLSALRYDDYPGSDQPRDVLLPFPYILIKTQRLEVDRDKVRGRLLRSGAWTLDIGVSGALPVDSDRNLARSGMPDIAWVGEVGPQLRYTLTGEGAATVVDLELLTRAAFSVGDPTLRSRGGFASPRLSFERHRSSGRAQHLTIEGNLGFIYGTRAYHAYYYEVAPAYATPGRPAYAAQGGWGGWRAALGVGVRDGHLWYGGFLRYLDINDAVYVDSSLVRTQSSLNAGLAIAYVF